MSNPIQMAIDDPASAAAHTASIGTLFGTAMGYLPVILAIIPAIYYLLLIYESKTVQHYLANRAMKRAAMLVALANAKKMIAEAKWTAANVLKEATKIVPAEQSFPEKCKRRRADGPTPCLMCEGECSG